MDRNELLKKYPWLKITTTVEDYVEPDYYGKLLKPYIFEGKTDLEQFDEFLRESRINSSGTILELGCGSGRVTDILLDRINPGRLVLVDLSKQMLEFSKDKYSKNKNVEFIKSDSIEYLENTTEKFDFIYSLWSFSHSTHQILTKKSLEKGMIFLKKVISKVIIENMKKGSYFYLVHFDSMSDEQTILLKQWRKVFPIFRDVSKQSPSKLLMDQVCNELLSEHIIDFETQHFVGEPIEYGSINEALEVFLNFHMESYFNESDDVEEIINELSNYFENFREESGKISIKPGCFIYKIRRL